MLNEHPLDEYGIGYYFREIGKTDTRGLFNFCKAIKNFRFEPGFDEEAKTHFNRCDNLAPRNVFLPSGFHEWDYESNVCSCGSTDKPYGTTNDHYTCLTHCKVFRVPIQTEHGFIVYLEYKHPENEEHSMQNSECNARTFQELFRYILEWAWVHENMGNNEPVAVAASEFIAGIDIPPTILEWLWGNVPDQPVARYLRGSQTARFRAPTDAIPDMTDEFNQWIEALILRTPTLWPYGPR